MFSDKSPSSKTSVSTTRIAHIWISSPNSHLEACVQRGWMPSKKPKNFDGLLAAWLAKLDTEELNKQFYRKLFAWYEWAVAEAQRSRQTKTAP